MTAFAQPSALLSPDAGCRVARRIAVVTTATLPHHSGHVRPHLDRTDLCSRGLGRVAGPAPRQGPTQ